MHKVPCGCEQSFDVIIREKESNGYDQAIIDMIMQNNDE